MKKTLIGVLPLVDPERNSFWMHPGYLHGIAQAGGLPVVLPMTMEEASLTRWRSSSWKWSWEQTSPCWASAGASSC